MLGAGLAAGLLRADPGRPELARVDSGLAAAADGMS
jgi:hypothetical protein